MKSELDLYLIMVSYSREKMALKIVNDFVIAEKPCKNTTFLVIDNFKRSTLNFDLQNAGLMHLIKYIKYENTNKSAAINFAINRFVKEENALIINIDNDIRFNIDFLMNYYKVALQKGHKFYFGGSFNVNFPQTFNKTLTNFYQGSALGKPDEEFLKMKNLMFLGFNFAFFKSQWQRVNGFDERFGPGSRFNLSGDESVFQKKLRYVGFEPYFIIDNQVKHQPEDSNYLKENVLKRNKNNGYTHGFQFIVNSNKLFKYDYWFRIGGMTKSLLFDMFNNKGLKIQFKIQYAVGYFLAFITYLKEPNKKSIYHNLNTNYINK